MYFHPELPVAAAMMPKASPCNPNHHAAAVPPLLPSWLWPQRLLWKLISELSISLKPPVFSCRLQRTAFLQPSACKIMIKQFQWQHRPHVQSWSVSRNFEVCLIEEGLWASELLSLGWDILTLTPHTTLSGGHLQRTQQTICIQKKQQNKRHRMFDYFFSKGI